MIFTAAGHYNDDRLKTRIQRPETGDLFAPRAPIELEARDPRAPEEERKETEDLDPVAEPEAPPPSGDRPSPNETLFFDRPFREFEHNGGVHLTDSILWCDADRRHDLCFISHAHADSIGKNRRILATDKTVRILTRGTGKTEALTSPYRRSFTLGPLELEMHPAGHVLGAAQLLVTRNDRRLVYTSDVNPRETATAESARPIACNTLVIPATYGTPLFKFPPREQVFQEIIAFIDRCLEDRTTPVLIANQIGTSQELMRVLGEAGHRLRVHRSIYDVAKIYRDLGVSLPGSRRFSGQPARDEVVIFPPILRQSGILRRLKKHEAAIVSGRAADPGFLFRHRVEKGFVLSDTADHDELVTFVMETGAEEVYLSSGYVEEMGEELRSKGLRVHSLVPARQLALF